LVQAITADFPCFRDEATYNGHPVFFYKRAQILVADLYAAFTIGKKKLLNIHNVGELTMFADYRVPQILHHEGVLHYSEKLERKISNSTILPHGSLYEIEIRAATIESVELIKDVLHSTGMITNSIYIDWLLWQKGEEMRDKMLPPHRTISIFY